METVTVYKTLGGQLAADVKPFTSSVSGSRIPADSLGSLFYNKDTAPFIALNGEVSGAFTTVTLADVRGGSAWAILGNLLRITDRTWSESAVYPLLDALIQGGF